MIGIFPQSLKIKVECLFGVFQINFSRRPIHLTAQTHKVTNASLRLVPLT